MNLRIALDSIVVLPARLGRTEDDVWSEIVAAQVTGLLAGDKRLRVIPLDRARALPGEDERSPEEIGRELHVNAAAVCRVSAKMPFLDLDLELIDVLGESTLGHETLLSSAASASQLHVQAARAIARWMHHDDHRIDRTEASCDFARLASIRADLRQGRFAGALEICRDTDLSGAASAVRLEIAQTIVAAPARLLADGDVALAKRAIRHLVSPDADACAARIACRFDFQWKRGGQRFAAACVKGDSSDVHASYALFLIATRRFDEAAQQIRWIPSERQRGQLTRFLDALLTGDTEDAVKCIRSVVPAALHDHYVLAQEHAVAGNRGAALSSLERAVEARSPLVMFLAVDPAFNALRKVRRFAGLMRRARIVDAELS